MRVPSHQPLCGRQAKNSRKAQGGAQAWQPQGKELVSRGNWLMGSQALKPLRIKSTKQERNNP